MKACISILLVAVSTIAFPQDTAKTQNIILVTWDGYRWQEMFRGADRHLIKKKRFVSDVDALKKEVWRDDAQQRRETLMPFIWSTIAQQGVLLGNRDAGSKMQVTNPYHFSYPGYNEIFCGYGDKRINSNEYPDNPNSTIFDFLQANDKFKNEVAAFATWDAFPRIINTKRNGVPVYVNFKTENGATTCSDVTIDNWKTSVPQCSACSKTDTMTYHFAKEYLQQHHPRFAFIGFDETDDFGHAKRYDSYLHTAHTLDSYMRDLWNFIQSDEHYRDNTTLIITCDHGRGRGFLWQTHAKILKRSKQIWLAAIGKGIKSDGELHAGKFYQNQIASTIATLFGMKFSDDKKIGKAIQEILK